MDTESSRQLIMDYYRAIERVDLPAVEQILADDVVWCPPDSAPIDGPFSGRDTVLAAQHESGARFFDLSSMKMTTHKIIAEGDTVVVLQGIAGKTAKGGDYSNEYVWVFTCANGKIVRMDEHTDSLRFHRLVMEEK